MRRFWIMSSITVLANVVMWTGVFFLLLYVIDYAARAFGGG